MPVNTSLNAAALDFGTLFLMGALLLVGVAIAWALWSEVATRRRAERQAVEGVGHELRVNLQRFAAELSSIFADDFAGPDEILPLTHPQLDAVHAAMVPANRNALAVISAMYATLGARKTALRAAYAQGRSPQPAAGQAADTVIDAIVALYLWECHDGARPNEAHSTRSWHVRDWMKRHGFEATLFPGMHLRDEVVERLRQYGMTLTPQPLALTAHEYYSRRYDRAADPRSPFGRRRRSRQEVLERDMVRGQGALELNHGDPAEKPV